MDKKILETTSTFLTEYSFKTLLAMAIFFIGKKTINILTLFLYEKFEKSNMDKSLETFMKSFIRAALNLLLLVIVISTLGVQTSSLVALLGAAGLAVGLALQGSLSNFSGGVLILIFRPFDVGDFIESGENIGTVKEIQIFSTLIDTIDNKRIIIPNGVLSNGVITNFSRNPERRIDFIFDIAYESDIIKVKTVLENIAKKHKNILKNKPIFVRSGEYADSSIRIYMRVWVKTEDYWDTYFDIMEEMKFNFDRENISIPFPQMDIHIKK